MVKAAGSGGGGGGRRAGDSSADHLQQQPEAARQRRRRSGSGSRAGSPAAARRRPAPPVPLPAVPPVTLLPEALPVATTATTTTTHHHHLDGLVWRTGVLVCVVAAAAVCLRWLLHAAPPLQLGADGDSACAGIGVGSLLRGALPAAVGGTGDPAGATRAIWRCAAAYYAQAPWFTTGVLAAGYVTLQALAIPGPLLLSIVAGALFGPWRAQAFIAVCATSGAAACYGLSHSLARPLLHRLVPARLADMRARVAANADDLLWYMMFLRITPACPNWLVNLASPLVGVPLRTFVTATAVGLLPANFFHAHTGAALSRLSSSASWSLQDNWRAMATLIALQFAALLPAAIHRRCGRGAAAPVAAAAAPAS